MTALRFTTCSGMVTIDVDVDVEDLLALDKNLRDQIFATIDELHGMFDEFVDPSKARKPWEAPAKKARAAKKSARPSSPPPEARKVDRPQIGDTRPTPDPRTITKHLKGDGNIRWDDQIKFLFDGTCDRIVREVANEKAATQQKYFIQNKDRRIRVDVVTVEGVTVIEVRRRGEDE